MRQAKEELTMTELEEGYIYAYWNCANFGFCKIGYTGREVDIRLREWETQCKHGAKRLYPPREEVAVLVPHVKRVEKLIHADLRDYRHAEPGCRGCSRTHEEWFTGPSQNEVKAMIEKWTQWMMSQPYEQVGGKLVLSESGADRIRSTCRTTEISPQVPRAGPPRRNHHPRSRGNVPRRSPRLLRSRPANNSENQRAPSHGHNLRGAGGSLSVLQA